MLVWTGEYNTVGAYTVIIKKCLKDFKQVQKFMFYIILDGFISKFFRIA